MFGKVSIYVWINGPESTAPVQAESSWLDARPQSDLLCFSSELPSPFSISSCCRPMLCDDQVGDHVKCFVIDAHRPVMPIGLQASAVSNPSGIGAGAGFLRLQVGAHPKKFVRDITLNLFLAKRLSKPSWLSWRTCRSTTNELWFLTTIRLQRIEEIPCCLHCSRVVVKLHLPYLLAFAIDKSVYIIMFLLVQGKPLTHTHTHNSWWRTLNPFRGSSKRWLLLYKH